jgi:CRISPR-associated RAMP protein (TIGR02581 family)
MFDVFRNRLELLGQLKTVTALRISQGRSMEPIGSDLPVVKDALGRPLIPGASFKGAMRSRLESFLRGILGTDRKLVANPAIEEEWSITSDEIKKFKAKYTNDVALTEVILAETDLASKLFGSPWLSSKFQVQDLNVVADAWFDQYQERDGVSIDRDTETAAEGKLYDFQVVPAGTPFQFRAIVENAEDWELGLLMIGLHQFENEMIPLGGGRSRGLGVVKLEIDRMRWIDVRASKDPGKTDPDKMLNYLKRLVMHNTDEQSLYMDAKPLKDEWVEALINHLSSRNETSSQSTVLTHES